MTLDLSCEDAGGSTDETFLSYSRRWVDLVIRGKLCVVMKFTQLYKPWNWLFKSTYKEVPLESTIRMMR